MILLIIILIVYQIKLMGLAVLTEKIDGIIILIVIKQILSQLNSINLRVMLATFESFNKTIK